MDKTVLLDSYINKRTERGDIGYDSREFHTHTQVLDRLYVMREFEFLGGLTWIAAWFLEFVNNIVHCRKTKVS